MRELDLVIFKLNSIRKYSIISDGRATLYDLLIARCPCIIGCLWQVTDGEIDRFFLALMEYCFTMKKDEKDKQNGKFTSRDGTSSTSLKLIAEGMAMARSHCKLQYLTGAAVVSYGLPVASLMNLILTNYNRPI
jgi:separase